MEKQEVLNTLSKMQRVLEKSNSSGNIIPNVHLLIDDIQKSMAWVESCNAKPLQEKQKCENCGKSFFPVNPLQKCCNTTCRVQLHRSKHSLKKFNTKVREILGADGKFISERIITDGSGCPFIVYIDGKKYEASSTKGLLSRIKKSTSETTTTTQHQPSKQAFID